MINEGCAVERIEPVSIDAARQPKKFVPAIRYLRKALAEHIGLRRRIGLSGAHGEASYSIPAVN
jgi:hypothetical protein